MSKLFYVYLLDVKYVIAFLSEISFMKAFFKGCLPTREQYTYKLGCIVEIDFQLFTVKMIVCAFNSAVLFGLQN